MSLDAISARARQFKRHAARWSARIEAHGDHAEQFRLSFADQFNDLAVVDVSEGGFALVTSFLVPKNLKLIVHVDAAADGGRTFLIRESSADASCWTIDPAIRSACSSPTLRAPMSASSSSWPRKLSRNQRIWSEPKPREHDEGS